MSDKLDDTISFRVTPRISQELDRLPKNKRSAIFAKVRKCLSKELHNIKYNPTEWGLDIEDNYED
ncbi:hypothetical protein [Candidatus Magnetobacterium casense]|uniref:hypothetical protein n=1 Tax=Candidatus Magnetobacterium casense TaxID=1455061 RepID=UPI00058B508A|nr:hypothetical protein [Candidatus Magnetobacterium casensis]